MLTMARRSEDLDETAAVPLLETRLEETCKLECGDGLDGNDVYDRFSTREKRVIVAIVSWMAGLPFFVAHSFVPCIPKIAEELNSSGSIVDLAVSVFLITVACSSLFWARYSSFYGRRSIYLAALPLLCIGSIGVGLAESIPTLMVSRFVQACGVSTGIPVGFAALADIYKLEERGFAIGIFFAISLVGLSVAPLVGGLVTHYSSWRHLQFSFFVGGIVALCLTYFFFPETSHPGSRGVDKVRRTDEDVRGSWRPVLLNPLKSLALLCSPNILAVALTGTSALLANYVMLIPLSYTIGQRYHITNEALVGAFFLPAGFGCIIGSMLSGYVSDRTIVKWRQRRGGEWLPEDRLRTALPVAFTLVPLSVLTSGFVTQYVSGETGIVFNLLCLLANGIGVDYVLSPSASYNADILHARSAEAMAANNCLRGILLSLFSAGMLPCINAIGVFPTGVISAALAWMGAGLLWVTVTYGDRMRAYVDVGFST